METSTETDTQTPEEFCLIKRITNWIFAVTSLNAMTCMSGPNGLKLTTAH